MSTECPQATSPIPRQAPAVFVWVVWALMLLAALAFVYRYGSRTVPYSDEWEAAPVLAGEERLLPWLWEVDDDHRMPLPKLLWLGLLKLTGYDFRAGMFFNVAALGVLALALAGAARRLRGRASYSDALFPLVLLGLGQWENLLWSWQVQFISSTALAGVLLILIVREGARLTPATAALAGLCLVLLPLCGSQGLGLVPALLLWLVYVGVQCRRLPTPQGKRAALVVGGFVTATLLVVTAYFLGYHTGDRGDPPARPAEILRTSIQFLTGGFGPAAETFWPLSGGIMLGLLLLSTAGLVGIWRKQPQQRSRALGLFLFLGAVASLALGLGWGRREGSWGSNPGFLNRYGTLAAPALCCAYLTWILYGGRAGRLAQASLFLLTCILFPLNTWAGLEGGERLLRRKAEFEKELLAGMPPLVLAEDFGESVYYSQERMAELLPLLRRAGVGLFRQMQDTPPLEELPFPVKPTAVSQVAWSEGSGRALGDEPQLVFALEVTQYVCAIRVKLSYTDTPSPAVFRLSWRRSDRNDFSATERNRSMELRTGDGEQVVTVAVNDILDYFRIDPDTKSCTFRIAEITLMVPDNPEGRDYLELIPRVREMVRRTVPPGATVLIVSKGDDELLRLDGRKGWHFPQTESGEETSDNPADSAEAIAHLEALRAKGAGYLVIPEPYLWWLDHYQEFRHHLETHYRVAARREEVGVIFALQP
jgi:hypothetical protein